EIYTLSLHDALPICVQLRANYACSDKCRVSGLVPTSRLRSGNLYEPASCRETSEPSMCRDLAARSRLSGMLLSRASGGADTSRGTPLTGIACPVAQRLP